MKLRYTLRALRHLASIADHIAERNPEAARGVSARIRETIDLLVGFPRMGHKGSLLGTCEMVVPGLPYIVVYRIEIHDEDTLVILGVYHGAQRRPGQEHR